MDSINNVCKFGSDAWLELQAFKTRQLNRREKLNRHKNLHMELANAHGQNHLAKSQVPPLLNNPSSSRTNQPSSPSICSRLSDEQRPNDDISSRKNRDLLLTSSSFQSPSGKSNSLQPPTILDHSSAIDTISCDHENPELVECLLLLKLCDVALKLPIDSKSLQRFINKVRGLEKITQSFVENLLQKFAHQELITIEEPTSSSINGRKKLTNPGCVLDSRVDDDEYCIYVTSADHTRLVEFDKSFGSIDNMRALLIESKTDDSNNTDEFEFSGNKTQSSVPVQVMRSSDTPLRLSDRDDCPSESIPRAGVSIDDTTSSKKVRTPNSKAITITDIKRQREYGEDLESLLSLASTREQESKKLGEELLELLSKPTAKEKNLLERFRSADGYQVQEFCAKGTKGECRRNNNGAGACNKLHFKKIIAKHTEESLGDCSFLNTCFHMDSCKYVHYEVDYDEKSAAQQHPRHSFKKPRPAEPHNKPFVLSLSSPARTKSSPPVTGSVSDDKDKNNNKSLRQQSITGLSVPNSNPSMFTLSPDEQAKIDAKNRKRFKTVLFPPQWIQCDLRFFDMSLLGKFSVVMADPPWDIHMELPYGTMSDDEMRKLNIPALQDEGVIFLWVTGRAMELGRECLALWGYDRCDEIIWVKTNQLQRIIRTGRTGHWLNHGKEHCLVGVKGNPKDINRGLDCDVIVAEVRATSHKPDEIYGIIERLSPGTRKIELFGRAHNVQPNWITLGNQLNGVRLIEPNLVKSFKKLNLPFQGVDHITQS